VARHLIVVGVVIRSTVVVVREVRQFSREDLLLDLFSQCVKTR
jgi:hypothetical protein